VLRFQRLLEGASQRARFSTAPLPGLPGVIVRVFIETNIRSGRYLTGIRL
jgi:hypothetical protein